MRIITRADFDGLVTVLLLKKVLKIDTIKFAHPKDMQDNLIPVDGNDVITNLPYVEGAGLWFDHHASERDRMDISTIPGRFEVVPSTARVIVNHYGADKFKKYEDITAAADKIDSADLSREEIISPTGYLLFALLADSRTGLGYYHGFAISNYDMMLKMIHLMENQPVKKIMSDPDVVERVNRYRRDSEEFIKLSEERSELRGKCVVTDFRNMERMPAGNRFIIYSIFPDANISIRIIDGKNREFAVLALGHSILNKTSKVDIGALMSEYGGGGHPGAGTCQIPYNRVDSVIYEIVKHVELTEKF